jgi:serine/threonine-protein kinase
VHAYRLEEVLGQGGSGTVYAAHSARERVALKVLRAELAHAPRERQRFQAEARLLERVDHPNVVKLVDSGVLPDGRPFLAMPLYRGETLAERLESGVPLPLEQALAIFRQLAGAAAALHAAGLVHRDIKPENVLLVDGEQAILLDLGIAQRADAPDEETGISGTPMYMAPERFVAEPASVRSDVYELAVVLYAMLTGGLPWAQPTDPDSRRHPAPPRDVPAPIALVLLRALAERPAARPESIEAFVDQLEQAAARATRAVTVPPPPVAAPRVGLTTKGLWVLAMFGMLLVAWGLLRHP